MHVKLGPKKIVAEELNTVKEKPSDVPQEPQERCLRCVSGISRARPPRLQREGETREGLGFEERAAGTPLARATWAAVSPGFISPCRCLGTRRCRSRGRSGRDTVPAGTVLGVPWWRMCRHAECRRHGLRSFHPDFKGGTGGPDSVWQALRGDCEQGCSCHCRGDSGSQRCQECGVSGGERGREQSQPWTEARGLRTAVHSP